MSTEKQKRLAEELIKNAKRDKPLNKTEIVDKCGYSKATSNSHQKKILEGEGVKEELKEAGFTEDNAKKVVSEIMLSKRAKNRDRLKATDLVFKVEGSFAPEKKDIDFKNTTDEELTKKIAEELADEID